MRPQGRDHPTPGMGRHGCRFPTVPGRALPAASTVIGKGRRLLSRLVSSLLAASSRFPKANFMALLHILLDQIDEARLLALIAAGAAESRTIDYKRASYGNTHADYSEFLADISSFANTSGGDIVLGMDATNGIPTAITSLNVPMDPEILRLEQVARGGLQPRIANIAFHVVPIRAGGNVLIIRVPRSYSAPHRIIRQGSNRFWARSAAGKYEPDVNELRTLFNAGPQLADRIRNFRLDRIAKIAAGEAPVQLMDRGILVLHVGAALCVRCESDTFLERNRTKLHIFRAYRGHER